MSAKELVFHELAHAKILAGMGTLVQAVRVTLGPKARTVVIERGYGSRLRHSGRRHAVRPRFFVTVLHQQPGKAKSDSGRRLAEEAGLTLERAGLSELGRVKRIEIDKDNTTLVGGAGDPAAIAARVAELRRQIKDTTSDYDREKLQERAAKLAGGVAVVKVGAATETEMKEKKARVEDAMHATHAAIEEGVLPGGGVALLRARAQLAGLRGDNADQDCGIKIVLRALEDPLRQIVSNAGEEPSVMLTCSVHA